MNKNKHLNIVYLGSKREHGKMELEAIGAKVYSHPLNVNTFKIAISLQKYIKKFKPDAILVESSGLICLIAFILGEINNLPYFILVKGNYKQEVEEIIPLKDNLLNKIIIMVDCKLYYFSIRRAKCIFTVSNYLAKEIGKQLDMPKKKIIIAYPSIDLIRFNPNNNHYLFKNILGLSKETRLLLTVMNFEYPLKVGGLIYFLESIGEVLNEYQNLKYVIAGDGFLKHWVERKVEKMGLNDSILLPGFVREIEKAYASSEFLIHTSFLDMAPLIILEAGASGKPVIVNRCGGIPELVNNGDTGFIIGKTDCKELKNKIIDLLEDDELRYNMGINARKRIEKLYNHEKIGYIYSKKIKEYI